MEYFQIKWRKLHENKNWFFYTPLHPDNNNRTKQQHMNAKDSSDDELIQIQSDLKDLKVREA
jgi:hypothetical protein